MNRFQIRKIDTPAKNWLNENVLTDFTKKLLDFTISDYYLVDNYKTWIWCSPQPVMVNTWFLGTRINHNLELTEKENEELFEIENLYDENEKDLCVDEGILIENVSISSENYDLNNEEEYKKYIENIIEYYKSNPCW